MALRKYIASFGSQPTTGRKIQFGTAEPCRAFRQLEMLSAFDVVPEKIQMAQEKQEIQQALIAKKGAKDAINELLTLSTAAERRLRKAIEQATSNADAADSGINKHKGKRLFFFFVLALLSPDCRRRGPDFTSTPHWGVEVKSGPSHLPHLPSEGKRGHFYFLPTPQR